MKLICPSDATYQLRGTLTSPIGRSAFAFALEDGLGQDEPGALAAELAVAGVGVDRPGP